MTDLLGNGFSFLNNSTTTIGTITVHVNDKPGQIHEVKVSNSSIFNHINDGNGISILNEFTFNPGFINHTPEPTIATLLAVGLVGLAAAQRRRR